jgi:uncharacterized protein YkwD
MEAAIRRPLKPVGRAQMRTYVRCVLRLLAIFAITAVTAFAATAEAPEAQAAACASANAKLAHTSRASVSRAMLCLINAERRGHGLRALRLDPRLSKAARDHSRDMVRRRYFAHTSPDGLSPADRVRGTGYLRAARAWTVGENIAWAWHGRETAASVMRGWMGSPPHREEILRPSFRDVGIGVVAGVPHPVPRGGGTYTADFGVRR